MWSATADPRCTFLYFGEVGSAPPNVYFLNSLFIYFLLSYLFELIRALRLPGHFWCYTGTSNPPCMGGRAGLLASFAGITAVCLWLLWFPHSWSSHNGTKACQGQRACLASQTASLEDQEPNTSAWLDCWTTPGRQRADSPSNRSTGRPPFCQQATGFSTSSAGEGAGSSTIRDVEPNTGLALVRLVSTLVQKECGLLPGLWVASDPRGGHGHATFAKTKGSLSAWPGCGALVRQCMAAMAARPFSRKASFEEEERRGPTAGLKGGNKGGGKGKAKAPTKGIADLPDLSQLPQPPSAQVMVPARIPSSQSQSSGGSEDQKMLHSLLNALAKAESLPEDVKMIAAQAQYNHAQQEGKTLHKLVALRTEAKKNLEQLETQRTAYEKHWSEYVAQLFELVEKQLQEREASLTKMQKYRETWLEQLADASRQLKLIPDSTAVSQLAEGDMELEDTSTVEKESELEAARQKKDCEKHDRLRQALAAAREATLVETGRERTLQGPSGDRAISTEWIQRQQGRQGPLGGVGRQARRANASTVGQVCKCLTGIAAFWQGSQLSPRGCGEPNTDTGLLWEHSACYLHDFVSPQKAGLLGYALERELNIAPFAPFVAVCHDSRVRPTPPHHRRGVFCKDPWTTVCAATQDPLPGIVLEKRQDHMDNTEAALSLATISGPGIPCGGPQTARGSSTLQPPTCTASVHTLYKVELPAPLTAHRTILACSSSSTRSCRRNLKVTFDEAVSFWFPGPGQILLGLTEVSVPNTRPEEGCIGSGSGSGPSRNKPEEAEETERYVRQFASSGSSRDGRRQGSTFTKAEDQVTTSTDRVWEHAQALVPGSAGCCHPQPCNRLHGQTSSAPPLLPTGFQKATVLRASIPVRLMPFRISRSPLQTCPAFPLDSQPLLPEVCLRAVPVGPFQTLRLRQSASALALHLAWRTALRPMRPKPLGVLPMPLYIHLLQQIARTQCMSLSYLRIQTPGQSIVDLWDNRPCPS